MRMHKLVTTPSIDELEAKIVRHSQQLNCAEYELLVMVREFDIRQGWKPYHFNNCAEWLDMKCGITYDTAREKVRVARALFDLPEISAAFESGELSYSKARALTRLATTENEKELLNYAIPATARQVEEHCRKLRNVQRSESTADVNRIHAQRYLSRNCHNDGSMTISIELTREAGDLVMKAIERAAAQLERNSSDLNSEHLMAQQADALVSIAQAYLAGNDSKPTSTADHYQVMVHVDEAALREQPGANSKSDLPLESVRRLCCDSSITPVTKDENGNPLNVGRKHRMVQPALKRALLARDKCCRYPGCTHDKWLDAHHVMHWIDGGNTSLDNTLLLCSRHHRLLHEGGFTIQKDYSGEWYFRNRAGSVVLDARDYAFDEIT